MHTNNLRILLYLFIVMLGGACHTSRPVNEDLRLADSIMDENPDTAMYVLQRIVNPEVMSEEEYAIYCLLTTQAGDLTNTPHTSDELITTAVHYFRNSGDDVIKAKAYFYMARVKEDMQQYAEAEENYLLALGAIEKTRQYKSAGDMYKAVSQFYQKHQQHTQSFDMQQKAYNNFLLAAREENKPHWILICLPILLVAASLILLIRYQVNLNKEKGLLKKQEKQLNSARLTIEKQKTELTHLKKELGVIRESLYNNSDVVRKIQQFNKLSVAAKEKPVLTEYEWKNYLNELDKTFGFVSSLKQTYHKLTDIDIRICALLREGITANHIGSLMNMTPETLSRRMQRIKSEKMNQDKSVSLEHILQSI